MSNEYVIKPVGFGNNVLVTDLPNPEQWGWKCVNGQYGLLRPTQAEQVDREVVTIICSRKDFTPLLAKCK